MHIFNTQNFTTCLGSAKSAQLISRMNCQISLSEFDIDRIVMMNIRTF
jgi:hypothetical protein